MAKTNTPLHFSSATCACVRVAKKDLSNKGRPRLLSKRPLTPPVS